MAKEMIDIGLDSMDDLDMLNGDFIQVESTAQHQRQLLLSNKGDYKQNPTICVGVEQYLNDEGFSDLIRSVAIEFTADGMDVDGIRLSPAGEIISNAVYK